MYIQIKIKGFRNLGIEGLSEWKLKVKKTNRPFFNTLSFEPSAQ
jgi:hypothetical protein